MKVKCRIVFCFFFLMQVSYGQSLHKDIQNIYNFEPHKLSREEQSVKVKLMDQFWGKIKADTTTYLRELRAELINTEHPLFFYYDGGHLLLSLTESRSDQQIALIAMSRSDLKDIDESDYVRTMNFFACNNFNTTEAGLKVIAADKFNAYIPQHALALDKGLALRFILLPIDSELYIDKVINKLAEISDTATIKYVLNFLAYTSTCKGDATILKYSNDKSQTINVQKYAASLSKLNNRSRRQNQSKYDSLIKERKHILSRVSDEALYELNGITKKLKKQYSCQ